MGLIEGKGDSRKPTPGMRGAVVGKMQEWTETTSATDVAEVVRRVATDLNCPLVLLAGADAVALFRR